MSLPANAPVFKGVMDPSDTLDFYVVVSQGNDNQSILMPGEEIAAYTLSLSPEAMAAGLQLLTDERRPVRQDKTISFWLSVTESARALPIFNGNGVLLGVELNIATTANPQRFKQRTFALRVSNQ